MFNQIIYDAGTLWGAGFLDTRASFFMDLLISFLTMLPLLVLISIFMVTRKYLKMHQFFQVLLFLLTFISLGLLHYNLHYQEEFETLLTQSSLSYSQTYIFLGMHALLSVILIFKWFFGIAYAISDRKRRALPGLYSDAHARSGKRIFLFILLTTLCSVGIYWILFVA